MRQSVLEKKRLFEVLEWLVVEFKEHEDVVSDAKIDYTPSKEVEDILSEWSWAVFFISPSCSFIHGTSVLISVKRDEYEHIEDTSVLSLYQKDVKL